ncbi:glycerophosphodiester phosphodiesterase GDPD1, chloroplastic-like protein [Tanacetum coccineum]
MATKAVHVSDVPKLDQVPENAMPLSIYATRLPTGVDVSNGGNKSSKFVVIGHRGNGMNILQSADRRMKAFKENSILSFNNAAKHPIDFIEFDVQVTKDDVAIIFHDDTILFQEHGIVVEKRVTDLTLDEFFSYGPQRDDGKVGKSLARKVNAFYPDAVMTYNSVPGLWAEPYHYNGAPWPQLSKLILSREKSRSRIGTAPEEESRTWQILPRKGISVRSSDNRVQADPYPIRGAHSVPTNTN